MRFFYLGTNAFMDALNNSACKRDVVAAAAEYLEHTSVMYIVL